MDINKEVLTINQVHPLHLEEVKYKMETLGAPTIPVVDCGDFYQSLEGSHRIVASYQLGLVPNFIVLSPEQLVKIDTFDWYQRGDWHQELANAGQIAEYLFSTHSAEILNFSQIA